MTSGIYLIKNTVNSKSYIGSTSNLSVRKSQHFRSLARNTHKNPHLQASFNKYGIETFEFSVIEYCPVEKLLEREDFYIHCLQSNNREKGYNIEEAFRCKMSEETKKKISIALTGKPGHPVSEEQKLNLSLRMRGVKNCLGHKLSDEHKRKISAAGKGRKRAPLSEEQKLFLSTLRKGAKHSEKTKKRMSGIRKGRVPSEEHRKRISESQKGRTFTEEHKKKLSEAWAKRQVSEETKIKMALSQKARREKDRLPV